MGERGPVGKRSEERRRRNKVETETATVSSEIVTAPPADPEWHPLALDLYESMQRSGQSRFYEPSDWASAAILCWYLTDLTKRPSAVAFQAIWGAMGSLLLSEGDRRRVRLEIEREKAVEVVPEGVSDLEQFRKRMSQ